jgi:transcriptional regulator with XRE-family HTH domain
MKRDDREAMLVRFGQNASRFRRGLGISQEELSFRAEVHRTQISLIERGERLIGAPTIVALAGAFEVPVGSLFDGIYYDAQTGIFRVRPEEEIVALQRPWATSSRELHR